MQMLSLAAAAIMTNASESTFRRRIADGSLLKMTEPGPNGRSMIAFDAIAADLCIPLDAEDRPYLFAADAGNPEAQNDMGMQMLSHKMPKSAIYWFELASKQEYPEAMYWLARCYLSGEGVLTNTDVGMMWLAKAAAAGHVIAKGLMAHMIEKTITSG